MKKHIPTFKEFINEGVKNTPVVVTELCPKLYHTSNPLNRAFISHNGLIPKKKSDTWIEDTPRYVGKAVFATNSLKKKDWFDSTYDDDIWEIDTNGLDLVWYQDPNFSWGKKSKHIYTNGSIPPENLTLIYEGTGE